MKELLKSIARELILPWALTNLAGIAAKKLAPQAKKDAPAR